MFVRRSGLSSFPERRFPFHFVFGLRLLILFCEFRLSCVLGDCMNNCLLPSTRPAAIQCRKPVSFPSHGTPDDAARVACSLGRPL